MWFISYSSLVTRSRKGAKVNLKDRKTKLLLTAVTLTAVVALATVGTFALFTEQEVAGANTFSTGTVNIAAAPVSALVTFSGMLPGDTVTNPQVISNDGSAELRYSVSSTATDDDARGLKDQLVLTIRTIDVTTPASPCDDFDGTQLYTGDLDSTDGLLIGNPATGQDGDPTTGGDRTLAAAASETLCFQVILPTSTDNSFQDAATAATFTYDAEQTVNN